MHNDYTRQRHALIAELRDLQDELLDQMCELDEALLAGEVAVDDASWEVHRDNLDRVDRAFADVLAMPT